MNIRTLMVGAAAVLASTLAAYAGRPVRVACVGNSITYGAGVPDRLTQSYPAVLARLLGDGYQVGNFGHSGATLLRRAYRPYMDLPEFRQALEMVPDVVVIHLGVNDTDPRAWPAHRDEFIPDYLALIDSFRAVNPRARILVSRLTPLSQGHRRWDSGTRDWHAQIQDAIETVAAAAGAELIDLGEPFLGRRELMRDAIHPDAEGAALMAQAARGAITGHYGGLSLPAPYAPGMVMQRGRPLRVHGRDDAGRRVTVALGENSASAVTDNRGRWAVTLPPMEAAVGLTLAVTDDAGASIVIDDVATGEVWLASGQSNMAFPLSADANAPQALARPADSLLRIYDMVPRWQTTGLAWDSAAVAQTQRLQYFRMPQRWAAADSAALAPFSAVAYWFGRALRDSLQVPVGIIANSLGGSTAQSWIDYETLGREIPWILRDPRHNDYVMDWAQARAADNMPDSLYAGCRHPYDPAYLFDAGMRPLEAYPLQGVIWYQGESNADKVEVHERLFPLVAQSLRRQWDDPRLPLLYVQLSSLGRPEWPLFRDSQRRMERVVPGVAMAVTFDVGHPTDVHPRQKAPVGDRLARLALHDVYGRASTVARGPLPLYAVADPASGAVTVTMDGADGGLATSDGLEPRTFELAQLPGLYVPAAASLGADGRTVVVTAPGVSRPVSVRYGWQPYTDANLVNAAASLPASTFQIDVDTPR